MKKLYLAAFAMVVAALAMFAVIASLPGSAQALIQVRCEAHPPGVPSDAHEGWGFTAAEAGAAALQNCAAAHDGILCELGPCTIAHHP